MNRAGLNDADSFRYEPRGRTPAFFALRHPVLVDAALIEELKEHARREDTDVRICLHDGPEADFHDMVILQRRGLYHRPHAHVGKPETWHVIDGEVGAFVFDDDGTVVDARRLSSQDQVLYRVAAMAFHTVVPITATIVYHESKLGPFAPEEDTIAAPWAPAEEEEEAARTYNERLLRLLE